MSWPTLWRKYSTARPAISEAFSWKPNGVSRRTAGTGGGPRRAKSRRWVFTIVGLVSPEPMITSRRGTVTARARYRRVLGPVTPAPSEGGGQRLHDLALQPAEIAVEGEGGGPWVLGLDLHHVLGHVQPGAQHQAQLVEGAGPSVELLLVQSLVLDRLLHNGQRLLVALSQLLVHQ